MKAKQLLFIIAIGVWSNSYSQKGEALQILTQSQDYTLENIVNTLMGDGVILTGFTSNKSKLNKSIGTFIDDKKTLGMKGGVVMSTGSVESIYGKNSSTCATSFVNLPQTASRSSVDYFGQTGDKDLETTIGTSNTFDACVLEFDIIPLGNTLEFYYVFASEEYDEFVGSAFNDAFAFYIQGKGIEGRSNLAILPKSNMPVSINNVNDGNPGDDKVHPKNSSYYKRNDGNILFEFDGYTKMFKVKVDVTPFTSYHIKIVIADVGDNALDSGVFIEHKSVKSYNEQADVYFSSSSSLLSNDALAILNNLMKSINANPNYNIYLSGHTDDVGDPAYNDLLSKERVYEVKKYLLENGVSEKRISLEYYGEDSPAADNSTFDGRKDNRRVEALLIPSKDEYEQRTEEELKDKQDDLTNKSSEVFQNQPNPAKGFAEIPVYLANEDAELTITDIRGVVCQRIYLKQKGFQKVNLNVSNYTSGIYIVSLIEDGTTLNSIKMIVQN